MSTTTAVRKPAPRLPQPASRYWKGKAPKGVTSVQSDSDEEEEQPVHDEGDVVPFNGDQYIEDVEGEEVEQKTLKTMSVSLRDVNISKEGRVIVAGREESGRTLKEEEESGEEEEEEEEEEEGEIAMKKEDEEESSEYESEDEEKPKLQFRPVFVLKRARVTVVEKDAIAQDSEEFVKRKEQEAEERRKQSHSMVAESIKRELAEKQKEEAVPDVDDADGLEPEAEFEAWRLRELNRIKKEKEEEILRDQEREEIERRRALPEEQRLKEDLERAHKSREKPKGQQRFLQKYWHKGAFHQDEDILKRHDYTEATESYVDMTVLPKVMQVKNFGKRSRTKYTHLLDQDTTSSTGGFGGTAPVRNGGTSLEGGGCFLCGGPHMKKDCPQNTGPRLPSGIGGSAAKDTPNGRHTDQDSWRNRGEARTVHERMDRRHEHYDRSDNHRNRTEKMRRRSPSYSRSRSRSPRGHASEYRESWRERPRSRERISMDDRRREKRQRVV